MLLLDTTRKPYLGSPMTLSHLTLSDLERSKSRLLRLRSILSCKGVKLGYMLVLNIDRIYMGSQMHASHTYEPDVGIALKGHGCEVI